MFVNIVLAPFLGVTPDYYSNYFYCFSHLRHECHLLKSVLLLLPDANSIILNQTEASQTPCTPVKVVRSHHAMLGFPNSCYGKDELSGTCEVFIILPSPIDFVFPEFFTLWLKIQSAYLKFLSLSVSKFPLAKWGDIYFLVFFFR